MGLVWGPPACTEPEISRGFSNLGLCTQHDGVVRRLLLPETNPWDTSGSVLQFQPKLMSHCQLWGAAVTFCCTNFDSLLQFKILQVGREILHCVFGGKHDNIFFYRKCKI